MESTPFSHPNSPATSVTTFGAVQTQLKKNRPARFGFAVLIGLWLMAIYAPLLTSNLPLWYFPPKSAAPHPAALSFPLFAALFDIRFFESGVDFFFNTLMVLSPILIVTFLLLRRLHNPLWIIWRRRVYWALALLPFALALVFWIRADSHPSFDYKQAIAEIEADGEAVNYLFPLLRYSYREIESGKPHPLPPSMEHPLGTDRAGRDVLARLIFGTRVSLAVGFVAVSLYLIVGIVVGAVAGYFGGRVDLLISRFIEIVLCFPTFFLILALAAFIEQRSVVHIVVIIGLTQWTRTARLVRSEFLRIRNLDYVQAAVALGLGRRRIIFGHMLPNALGPVLVAATFGVAGAILTESGLAFLGFSDASAPSWGTILLDGRFELKPWLILAPGAAIFIAITVLNLVGEAVRDALDPKLR